MATALEGVKMTKYFSNDSQPPKFEMLELATLDHDSLSNMAVAGMRLTTSDVEFLELPKDRCGLLYEFNRLINKVGIKKTQVGKEKVAPVMNGEKKDLYKKF